MPAFRPSRAANAAALERFGGDLPRRGAWVSLTDGEGWQEGAARTGRILWCHASRHRTFWLVRTPSCAVQWAPRGEESDLSRKVLLTALRPASPAEVSAAVGLPGWSDLSKPVLYWKDVYERARYVAAKTAKAKESQ